MKSMTTLAIALLLALGLSAAPAFAGHHEMNPCNPCSMKKTMNPCNPCAMQHKMNPCNPCAMKKHANPCDMQHKMNPCNPCSKGH
ncbi:MAG: hypothetical protein Q9M17_02630 [Mariprofundus sp.]|nr:hypothetical protein [Mariprofundus sp.]